MSFAAVSGSGSILRVARRSPATSARTRTRWRPIARPRSRRSLRRALSGAASWCPAFPGARRIIDAAEEFPVLTPPRYHLVPTLRALLPHRVRDRLPRSSGDSTRRRQPAFSGGVRWIAHRDRCPGVRRHADRGVRATRVSCAAGPNSGQAVEKHIDRSNATVPGDDKIGSRVSWRFAGSARYPSNPSGIT